MTNVQVIDAALQSKADQIAWHKANNPKLTAEQLAAFEAGFADGWRKAVSYLKLHGELKLKS